jgi:hypothetical protein
MIRKLTMLLLLAAVTGFVSARSQTLSPHPEITPRLATLVARRKIDGYDNYAKATFSFKFGLNGEEALSVTRNNWDVLFGNTRERDIFDVTMVTDDCSRIKDLGKLSWYDTFTVPSLDAYTEPTREPSVNAIEGHMYLVHSKDRDSDHYALFRVEALQPLQSVTISWKLLPPPEPSN